MGTRCEFAPPASVPALGRPPVPPPAEPAGRAHAPPRQQGGNGPGTPAGSETARLAMLTTASRTVPADALTGASGDVCAVRHTPYGLRLLIGDVRGKGPRAAVGAAALRRAFDRAADRVPTLSVLVDTLEWALLGATARAARQAPAGPADTPGPDRSAPAERTAGPGVDDGLAAGRADESAVPRADLPGQPADPYADLEFAENFATVLVAEVSPDGRRLRLVNRGHPAPLLLRPGRVRRLEPRQRLLPLGLGAVAGPGQVPAPPGPYADELPFPASASLLLFTDGITEARDAQGVFYDPLARLTRFSGGAPADLLDALHRDVLQHTGAALTDDLAMVAVRRAARAGDRRGARYGRRSKRPLSSG